MRATSYTILEWSDQRESNPHRLLGRQSCLSVDTMIASESVDNVPGPKASHGM